MRSIWLSLLLFVRLLCSCKTKEVAREVDSNERFTSEISALNEQAKVDTTKTKKVEQTEEFTRIIERETITEYDTEKQTPSKVTEKEKVNEQGEEDGPEDGADEESQGIKTKTDETENRGIADASKDSTYLFRDDTKMIETKEEVKEESAGNTFFLALGKWLGIGIVVLISISFVWKKIKKFLHL